MEPGKAQLLLDKLHSGTVSRSLEWTEGDHGQGYSDHGGDQQNKHDECGQHHWRHPHGGPRTGLGGSVTGGSATESLAVTLTISA